MTDRVLDAFGLRGCNVDLVSNTSFNRFYRVQGPRGRFALRRGNPVRIHVAGVERIEAEWLDRLADDGWRVPRIVDIVESDGLTWTLFEWVDGLPLRDDQRADDPERLGEMLALLHDHAAASPLIDHEQDARFDHVLFLPADDLVSGHDPMCAEAVVRVQATLDELWAAPPHDPHLLHGDLGWNNVMRTPDGLVPVDFQDLRWGFDVQDLAISIADCDRWNPGWSGRLIAGYAAIRPLPGLPDAWQRGLVRRSQPRHHESRSPPPAAGFRRSSGIVMPRLFERGWPTERTGQRGDPDRDDVLDR